MTNMKEQLDAIDSEQELIKVRDDIYRKIGRNLLNFQKIEQLLKVINTCSGISGYVSNFENSLKQRADEFHNQTMGTLVKLLFENTYSEASNSTKLDEEISEPYLSMSFGLNVDADFLESRKQSLKSLVDERNELVHHLLHKINLLSVESCLETDKYLDEQRERQITEHEQLSAVLKNMSELWGEVSAFYASDEGKKHIEISILQQSPIVITLFNLATSLARPDGWVPLHSAAQQLQSILPEEMANLKKRYGYKTLKEILLASELFAIESEVTKKGGIRVLYRVKPELANIYH